MSQSPIPNSIFRYRWSRPGAQDPTLPLSDLDLAEIVRRLAARPGHEAVRYDIVQLLTRGLDMPPDDVQLEEHIPEVRGRIDALLGRTVVEFKSDLRSERAAAEDQLTRYIGQRQTESRQRYVGIATDGADFVSFELRNDQLRELGACRADPADPRALLAWLSAAVAAGAELHPDPETVVRELGRHSLAWRRALGDLRDAWAEVGKQPEALLKRQLWAQRLEIVYGAPVDRGELFFQHTYLSTAAKTIAAHALGLPAADPGGLLAGRDFERAGVSGAVEADFFDWMLAAAGGPDLVRRIALHVGRFRLRDVQTDVLKGLYESLVDPADRHDLGEYYTPDWLAARMCAQAIDRPLQQRVLDPACGSGAFLFHALRRLLAAADAAGLDTPQALRRCAHNVLGIDVHPVAVQIARVTWLLALGEERLNQRGNQPLPVPVYLGDALQWNVQGFLAEREVLIEVPDDGPVLHFPYEVTRTPADFDAVIELMLRMSAAGIETAGFLAGLRARLPGVNAPARAVLGATYAHLCDLHAQGRNHIWGFVARNLVRPVWLSSDEQRADVVIGNPPWLAYRFMSGRNQQRFRDEAQRQGVWEGGKVATHQDLSAYFFARCCELYAKHDGRMAFVMPYAAMSRRQFQGFRSGVFAERNGRNGRNGSNGHNGRNGPNGRNGTQNPVLARFTQAWAFDHDVQPLFPVPSCALFARVGEACELPSVVRRASGELPRRDATPEEAERRLSWRDAAWPEIAADDVTSSPYQKSFRQGATLVPRFLCLVEQAPAGFLGINPLAPLVVSRRSRQEKAPWKDLEPLRGNVEREYLRPAYLGESIAPFRLLEPPLAVVPWGPEAGMLDAAAAGLAGKSYLASWLRTAEDLWERHRSSARFSFAAQLDYYGKLTAQLPPPPLRVVYSASGTLMAAALVRDASAVIDSSLYWVRVHSRAEAHYLMAVLTSETARRRVAPLQARGQWGARHFSKVMWTLPIGQFDPADPLHAALAAAGRRAERTAAQVPLDPAAYFTTARRQIRQALTEAGVSKEIDRLVEELLRIPQQSERPPDT